VCVCICMCARARSIRSSTQVSMTTKTNKSRLCTLNLSYRADVSKEREKMQELLPHVLDVGYGVSNRIIHNRLLCKRADVHPDNKFHDPSFSALHNLFQQVIFMRSATNIVWLLSLRKSISLRGGKNPPFYHFPINFPQLRNAASQGSSAVEPCKSWPLGALTRLVGWAALQSKKRDKFAAKKSTKSLACCT
jgi:hypothetical protein